MGDGTGEGEGMGEGGSVGERDEILQGIRQHLERQVDAGRRFVIDGDLGTMLAAPTAPPSAPTAPPSAPTAPPSPTTAPPSPPTAPAAPTTAPAAPTTAPATPMARPLTEGTTATPPAEATRSTQLSNRSSLSAGERATHLAELETKALACTRCPLHRGRTQVVFGTGNPDADLMFIGEAPGRDEDLQGEPFVGRAGQLLTRIIEAIELERSEVYIANVLKCRPPENRNPNSAEIALCSPILYEQIEWVAPKVICALGRFACMTLLSSSSPLGRMRGQLHDFQGIPVVVTYHPAALLRYEKLKRPTWQDIQVVQKILAGQTPKKWAN